MAQNTGTPASPKPQEDVEEPSSQPLVANLSAPPPTSPPLPNPNSNCSCINAPPALLHLSFNQDSSFFAAGTSHGLHIYNTDPFREFFRQDFSDHASATASGGSGVGIVGMLFRSYIIALVGGGPSPLYPKNKVMVWDEQKCECFGELTFRSEVKAVRLRRDHVVVVLLQKLLVYRFENFKLVNQIETYMNPKGLCEVSHVHGSFVLVCPGLLKGQVRVERDESKRINFITAHESRLACFALSQDGRLLATASGKGTLIRVFNTLDGSLLQEVRRGKDRAEIYSLAFSQIAQWLAVSSDRGTVHLFSLKFESGLRGNDTLFSTIETNPPPSSSSLSFIRGVLPKYFRSEWSVSQFRLHEGTHYIVAFGHERNTVLIIGMDGSFYRCQFDPTNGGDMKQLEYCNFMMPGEAFC